MSFLANLTLNLVRLLAFFFSFLSFFFFEKEAVVFVCGVLAPPCGQCVHVMTAHGSLGCVEPVQLCHELSEPGSRAHA